MSAAASNRAFWTDPELSKFDPLPRIIAFDQFSKGFRGYTALVGNYEHTLDNVLPGFRDMNQPMLSNGTHWDTGSHGGHDGTYALKIASRARPRSASSWRSAESSSRRRRCSARAARSPSAMLRLWPNAASIIYRWSMIMGIWWSFSYAVI